jgi:hypothetical protein
MRTRIFTAKVSPSQNQQIGRCCIECRVCRLPAEQTLACKLTLYLPLAIGLNDLRWERHGKHPSHRGKGYGQSNESGSQRLGQRGGSRHYLTNWPWYRGTSNLFAGWARKGPRLLHH